MSLVRDLCVGIAVTIVLAVLALHALPEARTEAPAPVRAAPPFARAAAVPALLAASLPDDAAPSSVLLRTRSGHGIELHGDDVAACIARRSAAARTGDARAAYEIYQATSLCAAAEPALLEFEMPAERAEADAERRQVRVLCARVSPAQVQERMAFLARAAQAGMRAAQIDFFMEGPAGRTPDTDVAPDETQLQAWREQALGFLRQAGARCDAFALSLLANAYDLGQLAPRDARTAMTYAIGAAAARGAALPEAQLRARFGALLAPGEFEAALQAGAALAHQACPVR
jgi:hypothetical protein